MEVLRTLRRRWLVSLLSTLICITSIYGLYKWRRRLAKLLLKDPYSHLPIVVDSIAPDADFIKTLFNLSRLAEKLPQGLGIIRRFGFRRRCVILVTRPHHVFKILQNSTVHGMGMLREATQDFVGKKSLFALEGDEWRTQRLIMRNALHSSVVQSTFAGAMENVAFRMVLRLAERIKTAPIVDLHGMFARMHISTVAKAFFNDDFGFFKTELYPNVSSPKSGVTQVGSAREEILQAFEFLLRELPKLAYDVKFREAAGKSFEVYNPDWRLFSGHARAACRTFVRSRVQTRSERPIAHGVLDEMIDAQREVAAGDDEHALIETVTDNVVQLIFAGFNTVVVGLSFSLFYLAQNPVWWESVRAEADAVFSTRDFSQSLSQESLPVLNAVFSETLRLVPPTGFTGRILQHDLALDEHLTLPAGSDVFLPIVYLAQQESVWGADAAAFNPRRWLEGPAPPPGAYVPFSAGPRSCIGEAFARKSALTALSMLVHFFSFDLVPGAKQMPRWTGFGLVDRTFQATRLHN